MPPAPKSPPVALADDFLPATAEAWRGLIDKVLKGEPFEKRLVSRSADGVRIEPLYTRPASPPPPSLAPTRSDGRWDIRQRFANRDAKAANAEILEDLAGGVSSVLLQLRAPGQFGLVPRLEELKTALDGVLLDAVTVAFDPGQSATNAAGALIALWKERGLAPEAWRAVLNADPLGLLARTGYLYDELPRALKIAVGLAGYVPASPHVSVLLADGRPVHAAGGGEVDELAFMAASFVTYLRALDEAGLKPEAAAPKIAVALATDTDQMLSIAKLRAARRMLSRIGGALGLPGLGARVSITAETASRMMAKRDSWSNLLRVAIATAAAAMGGADAITAQPFTAALGLPDRLARRIARNTQVVLMEESGLGWADDPAAGAYALEALTDDLDRRAWARLQELEACRHGGLEGLPAALIEGSFAEAVAKTALQRRRDVATGKTEVIGVSGFPKLGDDGLSVVPFPKAPDARLSGAAATALTPLRLAEPFEALRDRSDRLASATPPANRIFLAALGSEAEAGPRAMFVRNLLASAGLEAVGDAGLEDAAAAVQAFKASGAKIAVIAGPDARYGALAGPFAAALKAAGALRVLLAARESLTGLDAIKAQGVDQLLSLGQDRVELLGGIVTALEAATPA